MAEGQLNKDDEMISEFAYGVLRKEIEASRDKAWKVFSWVSTVLLGTVGGLVAFASKSNSDTLLSCWPHRFLLLASVIVLAVYASLWVRQNLKSEEYLLERVKEFEIRARIRKQEEKIYGKPWFGYRLTIVLLAVAAIAAIWLIPSSCSSEIWRQSRTAPSTDAMPPSAK